MGAAAPERLNVKLGLWEMTSIMRFSGVPPLPKEVLDKMTPQARAKMIADLKAASQEEPEPETSSECITQEDLDKPFQSANSEDCKQTIVRTTRTSQEIRMVCTGKTSGSGTFKVNTPTPETMNGTLDLEGGRRAGRHSSLKARSRAAGLERTAAMRTIATTPTTTRTAEQ